MGSGDPNSGPHHIGIKCFLEPSPRPVFLFRNESSPVFCLSKRRLIYIVEILPWVTWWVLSTLINALRYRQKRDLIHGREDSVIMGQREVWRCWPYVRQEDVRRDGKRSSPGESSVL